MKPLLQLEDVCVAYRMDTGWMEAVKKVSLTLGDGETLGIVGESGCGKSSLAYAIMNYLGEKGRISSGVVRYRGQALNELPPKVLRHIRGQHISMVYQNPGKALHPGLRVGRQITEVLRHHEGLSRQDAHERATAMLHRVHLPTPEAIMQRYPHQLSGGQQQRIVIAMALITHPDLVILDEPTTGLDATTKAAVIDLLNELQADYRMAILYISHDLSLVSKLCDQVAVMYAGEIVETGHVDDVFTAPAHPYTRDLLACIPTMHHHYRHGKLSTIPGRVPTPGTRPDGCTYAPRCGFVRPHCQEEHPSLLTITDYHQARCYFSDEVQAEPPRPSDATMTYKAEQTAMDAPPLQVANLFKQFGDEKGGWFRRVGSSVEAVKDVSFNLQAGEILALVGESGSGKTTLGHCIVGLLRSDSGSIRWQGNDATQLVEQRPQAMRKAMQMIYQMPDATLNPLHTIGHMLNRTLQRFGVRDAQARNERMRELLAAVRLDADYQYRYPAQLSGGEKQRVAIARAFAASPEVIVCDEAVSALDVSVQAAILNLLVELKEESGCAYLFIAHDLAVVRYLADRIAIMRHGELVEIGHVERIFTSPEHPYTRTLLSALPHDVLQDVIHD